VLVGDEIDGVVMMNVEVWEMFFLNFEVCFG
jgi:hypothetical protein